MFSIDMLSFVYNTLLITLLLGSNHLVWVGMILRLHDNNDQILYWSNSLLIIITF